MKKKGNSKRKPGNHHKKNNLKKSPDDNIHVSLKSPKAFRKWILSLTIETIEALKRLETFKDLRVNKVELLEDLRIEIHEINKLTKALRLAELPLKMNDLDNLSMFKEKKKALEELEKKRAASEKRWETMEQRLQKAITKGPKVPKVKQVKVSAKPRPTDKLEADLQSLREKMAQL